jgi:hypothetical protein
VNAHGLSWKTREDARKNLENVPSSPSQWRFRTAGGAWPLPGGTKPGVESRSGSLGGAVSTNGAALSMPKASRPVVRSAMGFARMTDGAWPILFVRGVDVPAHGSVASQPSRDPLFTVIRAEKTFQRSRRRGNY